MVSGGEQYVTLLPLQVGLVALGMLAVPAGVWFRRPLLHRAAAASDSLALVPQFSSADRAQADSAARLVVTRAPFRLARRPSVVPYDPEAAPRIDAPAAPAPPKPTLVLTGIVWGSDPLAVLEGVPGTEGPRVVRKGDVAGGLRVMRMARDKVWISGFDTTWALEVREPWR